MLRRWLSSPLGKVSADVLAAVLLAALVALAVLFSGEASDFIYIDF